MKRLKSLEILKDQGLTEFFKLWKNIFTTKIKNKFYYNKYKSDWKNLKNLYHGKRVFLIGNGPSLNKTPLYLLKNEYTLSFNRFNILLERLNWLPTMYMCVDGLVAEDMANEINQMTDLVKHSFFTTSSLTTNTDFTQFVENKANVHWMLPKGVNSPFNFDLPYVNVGGSVAIAGLQVLRYLGFKEIYLLGIDMNYKVHETAEVIKGNNIKSKDDDDPNHFDPRYFGAGRKYHQPKKSIVDTILGSFERIAGIFKQTDTKVYNATVGGVLESYERKEFNSLFNITATAKKDMFIDNLQCKTTLNNILNLLNTPANNDYSESDDVIILNTDKGCSLLAKLIYTHIPFGPYNHNIYFINRSFLKN
ncbi:6-hydroxymethylpterin diphosphokinase MptE-like protein [Mucilaginibacter segetis]|uniref:DUF115 domain-containing protein n=1 Tax=Mucilaginibacter segetis TaxID=2793071 RepID=A0A934PW03_9SPHI|nr:6-hydroxymethylpterin diphosphokinase MptE-like protein [Mucilaginibacter segetis]MBK0380682.1 DUF115 domain-containing protein [Mucilaginibacter segetis]